jgi:hypothetical protein
MGSPSPQEQAAAAWFMGLERANRPKTPGERARARQADADARAANAAGWVTRHLPDLTGSDGQACSFAVALALRLRTRHPDLTVTELATGVRAQREVWMRRCGAWDQDDREMAA